MKQASASYKSIRGELNSWYEIRVTQGTHVYGMSELKSVAVSPSLTSEQGICIGCAQSAECRLELLASSSNWPRMAKFTIEFRICNSNGSRSEWITFGTYYTDERSEDGYGNLSIVAFDGMLTMETSWTDKIPSASLPSSWPITARAWAVMIQNAGLATFEDVTDLDNTAEFIGLDTTTTIRDVLKTIAAAHGGNWVMTSDEQLKLVAFENRTSDYIALGLSTQTYENSPALDAVTGAYLETELGTVTESGSDTGYVVKGLCDFANADGIAALCLARTNGYIYRPFTVDTAYLDPIADVGDSVMIDGTIYQIMSIDWDLNSYPTANVSAPYDWEVDHEYTIVSADAKNYRKTMSKVDEKMEDYVQWTEVSTAIEQNAESVVIAASGTYVTKETYDAAIADIQNQLDGNIQSWSGNVVPTLTNAPAVDWTTNADKAEHVGDLYFVNSDAGIAEAGLYYRFEENDGVYSWQVLTDSALSEALNKAAAALAAAEDAQDTADEASDTAKLKGRIFVVQPTPPYDVGDLWFNNTESVIKVCMTARESGSFVDSDWVKRDKYTDDSAFEAFKKTYDSTISAIKSQIDQKAETFYQATDPMADWDGATIAGIAIAGISKASFDGDAILTHEGDLWYRTTDNTTWYFDGTKWVQQDVSDEVFDKIDGKAQIFITTPYPPYSQGDLWFNSDSEDIMTCVVDRESGNYVASDWEKRNKYTDDTALNDFVEVTYSADLIVMNNQISAKVQKDQSDTKTSFGWVLDETAHTWYSNNNEVMKVNKSGLTVKGTIQATSGYFGSSQTNGFTIGNTAIYNPSTKSTLASDSVDGVYIGTNGIALGKGVFKVTSAGAVTASNISITGGSIVIKDTSGNTLFSASSSGVYVAGNATFAGTVYAKNVVASQSNSTYGTFNGSGLTYGTVGGGVSSSGYATGALSTTAAEGAAYGNAYGLAVKETGGTYPSYFGAQKIQATAGFYSGIYKVYGEGGEVDYDLTAHYHTITITNGKVQLGAPTKEKPDPFDIASYTLASGEILATNSSNYVTFDTGFSFDLSDSLYTWSGASKQYGRIALKDSESDVLKTIRVVVPSLSSVTVTGAEGLASSSSNYTTYDKAASFASSSIYTSGSTSYARVKVTLGNGNTAIIRAGIPYTDTSSSVTVSAASALASSSSNYTTYDKAASFASSSIYTSGSTSYARVQVTLSNGKTAIIRAGIPYTSSSSVTAIESNCTASNYSDFHTVNESWYLYVRALDSSGNTLYTGDLNMQFPVDYGYRQGYAAAGGGSGTSYSLYCTNRTENSAGLVTCDFSISSYNGLPWRSGNYYSFKYG